MIFLRRLFARRRERRTAIRERTDSSGHGEAIAELRIRFREAQHLLRRASSSGGRLGACLDRLSGAYTYRLPWYLVVGGGAAGKTSALANSGLELSMVEQATRAAGRVEPTRQCDWWFCNDAVLVDTPGHYLIAADDTARRGAEWGELLALLRKHRRRQPVNGVLLTVGVDELVALSEPERVAYATRLRQPLQLMQTRLDLRVPIYVCFTKMDRICGFSDYFSSLNRDGRAQVWGTTFSRDAATANHAFGHAFDALTQRLHEGLRDVLIADPDRDSRARAFLFPQQFASLRESLDDFCTALFRPSRLETNLQLRGVYFTSARQDTAVIDRVLDPVRAQLQIAAAQPSAHTGSGREHGYFLQQLLSKALFADAGFAEVSRALRRRRRIVHAAMALLTGGIVLALLIGWTNSYLNNRAYLDEVNSRVAAFNRQAARPVASSVGAMTPLVPLLDALQDLPRSERFEIGAPTSLRYGMGLYQGQRIRAASDAMYRRALAEKLLPQAAVHLESILANAPLTDPEYAYDALKAYLMLHDVAHYDGNFLAAWLMLDAEKTLPSNVGADERARLEAHLTNLFEPRPVTSSFVLDAPLVGAVRERLAHEPLAQRAYHLIRRELLRTMQGAPITVVSAGGPQAALVFRRASGKPLTEGINRLYTYHGYRDVFDGRVIGAVSKLREEEPWVLGIDATPGIDNQRIALEVRRAYFDDYIDVWDSYLSDLTLIASKSIAQSTQIARTLSAPDSPLKQFLSTAANETHLLRSRKAPDKQAATGGIRRRIGEARRSLVAMFGNAAMADSQQPVSDERPEAVVDNHFEPLRRLVASTDGAPSGAGGAPLDSSLRIVDQLYSYLTSAGAALNDGSPPPQTDVFNTLQADAGRLPVPLRDIFSDLSRTGSAQISGATRANLTQDAQGSIGRLCQHMIAGRYPFARNSPRDVALDDFSKLFAPGGLMDSFFQKNLTSQIDISGSRWRFRRNATGTTSSDARLAGSFQNADLIRTVFFSGTATVPSLQVELTPLDLDPGIAQYTLDVDGQTIRYAHGPQIPTTLKWPNLGGTGLVSLQISSPTGTDGLQTQGPWALYRMLDKARITPGATPESFIASFDFHGRKLSLRVTASSSYNPFRLPQIDAFSCPS